MTKTLSWLLLIIPGAFIVLSGAAISAQDKYTVQVPGGLSLSECRGYEDWPDVAVSHPEDKINVIVANPTMIEAYRAGIPGNGKPFPDGAKMAKIHWNPKKQEAYPGQPTVPGTQHDVDFMVKDSNRFADSGGWGWAQFDYDPVSATFTPNTSIQEHDAKCGFACHTPVKAKDYVYTAYPTR